MWSILPPTIRYLQHWPANEVDSAWNDQPLTYTQKAKISLFEPPFRALKGKVRTPSVAHWKARGRLYIRRNWTFFRYLLRLRRYERKSVEVGVFQRGWVTLSADFRGKGASPTNYSWYQSSRVIALSCGIETSAVRHVNPRVWQTDRRTDRQTERRIDRIRTPKTALAYARAVKSVAKVHAQYTHS